MNPETFVPRCAWCGRLRDSAQWLQERLAKGGVDFTHGICPECKESFFSSLFEPEAKPMQAPEYESGKPKATYYFASRVGVAREIVF